MRNIQLMMLLVAAGCFTVVTTSASPLARDTTPGTINAGGIMAF
ncbi:hypothetical protein [Flavihumibacter petaseus]|nr:hypothetical protein [Flavihumibacter petaseus]